MPKTTKEISEDYYDRIRERRPVVVLSNVKWFSQSELYSKLKEYFDVAADRHTKNILNNISYDLQLGDLNAKTN